MDFKGRRTSKNVGRQLMGDAVQRYLIDPHGPLKGRHYIPVDYTANRTKKIGKMTNYKSKKGK